MFDGRLCRNVALRRVFSLGKARDDKHMPRLLDQDERKERKTKQQEEARSARAEYRKQQLDIRERTARLRALRLARQTNRKGVAQRNA